MKFSIRVSDLELRSCDKHLLSKGEHITGEIVQWSTDKSNISGCWTLASWTKNKEGFDLKFVGDRPFDVDSRLFMELAKHGQLILDHNFNELTN